MSDVWDENWFGSTKTLDVHVGFLRRKLDDDPADAALPAHRARRRLPLRGRGRRVSLRARLLIALGYLVALVIVAFAVPLGAEPARPRRRTRCAPTARTQADVLAAGVGAADRDARPRAARRAGADGRRGVARARRRRRPARPGARRHRRPRGDRRRLLEPPGAGRRARRRPVPGRARARRRSTQEILATARAGVRRRPRRRRRAAHAERRRGQRRRAAHRARDRRRRRWPSCSRRSSPPSCSRAASRARSSGSAPPPTASPPATSTPARRSRAAASSARSRARST